MHIMSAQFFVVLSLEGHANENDNNLYRLLITSDRVLDENRGCKLPRISALLYHFIIQSPLTIIHTLS